MNLSSFLVAHLCFSLFVLFITGSSAHITNEAKQQELMKWKAPIELKEAYPYYMSGYDSSGNPVWVLPFGKWQLRWLSEGGSKFAGSAWTNYTMQMWRRLYDSPKKAILEAEEGKSISLEENNNIEGFVLVVDADGYSHREYLFRPSIKKTLELFQMFYNIEKTDPLPGMKMAFVVNVNFAGQSLWTVISSQLGPFASKFDLYGTTKYKWKQVLLREVSANSLPKSLGGFDGFKPIQLHG